MSGFKIFKEILEIVFGLGIIAFAISFGVFDPWIFVLGGGLIAWAAYNVSKELRDSRKQGDVASMAAERDRIRRGE